MNTIKIYLSESLSVADLRKDFPLYQGQYQSKLLNVFVPKSLLSANYDVQHYIGKMTSVGLPSNDTLNAFVITHTPTSREPQESDFIDVVATIDENIVLYRYTFTTEWTYEQVESFAINQMAGTSVKLGMVSTAPNGQVVKSKSYYMRYLKDLTYQNVEYALYERKLPKEFTTFSGVGENAPKMVINVVNVSTDGLATINDIVCSQTCSFEVLPSSVLDRDESIQPSELETLTALVNELIVAYNDKQDKNSNSLNTTSKAIVGAINELKGQQDINTDNISTAQGDISDLEGAVSYIEEHFATPETYIGQMTGSSLPSDQDLTDFVEEETGESPKNADVIIFVLQVSGGTDKNYKYIYSASGWNGYEIPPMEIASNGNAGIVQGTYNIGDTNNTLVDIVGGKIKEVYVNVSLGGVPNYITLSYFVPALQATINNIISGDTQVGYSAKADKDGNGNTIASTYMTNVIGASKTYVKNYALPRTFNDIYYYSGDDNDSVYSKTNDSTLKSYDANISLGYTPLLTAIMTTDSIFELSNKNSFENTFYLKDSSVLAQPNDHVLYVRVETSISQDNGTTYTPINVEVSNLITFTNTTDLVKVEIGGIFDLLGESVINVQEGDLIKQEFSAYVESSNGIDKVSIYWGSNYPLKFSLNTQQVVFSSGLLGQEPIFANDSSSDENIVVDGETKVAKIYYLPDAPQLNDGVEGMFVLTGNLQNADYIGLRVGDSTTYEEFALKIPLNYYDNTKYVGLSDIDGLPIRKNDASNDQIVFKGFIRNNYVDKYILIDISGTKITAGDIDSENATSGQVLMANGTGGASWQNASGGIEIVTISTGSSGTFTNAEMTKLSNGALIYHSVQKLFYYKYGDYSSKYEYRCLDSDASSIYANRIDVNISTGDWTRTLFNISNEGIYLKSTGETSGKVLTADGNGGASWTTPSASFDHYIELDSTSGTLTTDQLNKLGYEDSVVIYSSGGAKYVLKKNSTYTFYYMFECIYSEYGTPSNLKHFYFVVNRTNRTYTLSTTGPLIDGVNILSTGATNGKVLTANGTGGASWETPSVSFDSYITLTGTSGTLTATQYNKITPQNSIIIYNNELYIKTEELTGSMTFRNLHSLLDLNDTKYYTDYNKIVVIKSTYGYTISTSIPLPISNRNIKSETATSGQVLTANGSGGCSWENKEGAWTSGTGGTLSLGTATGLYQIKGTTTGAWFLYRGDTTYVWTSSAVGFGSDLYQYVKVTTDGVLHLYKHDIGTSTEEELLYSISYRKIGEV